MEILVYLHYPEKHEKRGHYMCKLFLAQIVVYYH